MMRRTLAMAGIVLVTAGLASAAQGQRGARADDALSPGEVMRILDGYAVVQAQDALQLSESQYGTFVTRLRKLHEARRRQQQARNRILQELRRLAGPQAQSPDEHAIREQLKALRAHDDQATLELQKAFDAVDEVLDARQQARFRLFEESLERRKLDLIMRARQGAARRGGS